MPESVRALLREFPRHPWEIGVRLLRSWMSVSLVAGLVATVFDLSMVISLVELAHFNPALAAPVGVAVGGTVNFIINKIFSFKDAKGSTEGQYLRFIAGMAVAATIHAGLVYLLTNRLGLHYVISKLIADILVFTVGNMVLLRFIAFPSDKKGENPRDGTPLRGC